MISIKQQAIYRNISPAPKITRSRAKLITMRVNTHVLHKAQGSSKPTDNCVILTNIHHNMVMEKNKIKPRYTGYDGEQYTLFQRTTNNPPNFTQLEIFYRGIQHLRSVSVLNVDLRAQKHSNFADMLNRYLRLYSHHL